MPTFNLGLYLLLGRFNYKARSNTCTEYLKRFIIFCRHRYVGIKEYILNKYYGVSYADREIWKDSLANLRVYRYNAIPMHFCYLKLVNNSIE